MNTVDFAQLLLVLESLIFLLAVFLHLSKKNKTLIVIYSLQSLALIALLVGIGIVEDAQGLLLAAGLTFVTKVVLAPIIFTRAIKHLDDRILTGSYLSTPLTLIVVLILLLLAYSDAFAPLAALSAHGSDIVHLAFAGIIVSLFLTINRKGIVHQIIGVLSMENGIVALASIIGLEQTGVARPWDT
ncbi:MAG: hypothetical protein AAB855_00960 [Patescibacteria group bacterium]